jgi:glycyl-tRNA synthetase (class II)
MTPDLNHFHMTSDLTAFRDVRVFSARVGNSLYQGIAFEAMFRTTIGIQPFSCATVRPELAQGTL